VLTSLHRWAGPSISPRRSRRCRRTPPPPTQEILDPISQLQTPFRRLSNLFHLPLSPFSLRIPLPILHPPSQILLPSLPLSVTFSRPFPSDHTSHRLEGVFLHVLERGRLLPVARARQAVTGEGQDAWSRTGGRGGGSIGLGGPADHTERAGGESSDRKEEVGKGQEEGSYRDSVDDDESIGILPGSDHPAYDGKSNPACDGDHATGADESRSFLFDSDESDGHPLPRPFQLP
jgi:hypothetical protein